MRQNVVAFNTEQVVTGTKQVLKLQSVQQISQQIPEIQSPRTCHDLSYEYQQSDKQAVNSRQERERSSNLTLSSPEHLLLFLKSQKSSPLNKSRPKLLRNSRRLPENWKTMRTLLTKKSQIVEKLQKIARELE